MATGVACAAAPMAALPETGGRAPQPYLERGKPAESAAARRWPDLGSCAIRDAGGVTRLDWTALDSLEAVQVCLFRVADGFGDPAAFRAWMEAEGFVFQVRTEEAIGHLYGLPAGTPVTADAFRWFRRDAGALFGPTAGRKTWWPHGPYIIDVVAAWDADGRALDISTTTQGRWSGYCTDRKRYAGRAFPPTADLLQLAAA